MVPPDRTRPLLFLALIGIFTAADYRSKRKIAILIIVVAGAVLTPGQDPFSQCMLAIPMIILYEIGILLVARRQIDASKAMVD